MLKLNKTQIEAIVEEVQDQLEALQTQANVPARAVKEWEKLSQQISELRQKEVEREEADERLDRLRDEYEEMEREVENRVNTFEKRHGVDVEWKYVDYDEGEKPEVKFPAKDYREKIRRQIAILSIEKGGPMTADELIEKVTTKFSQ